MSNKIKYGLKNVYIAVCTKTLASGSYTYAYAAPVALHGAVNLSLDAEGDSTPFYADDVVYFRSVSNNGYSGSLELALVPDWFRETILQETADSNGVLAEYSTVTDPVCFAMLFEFDGDAKNIRHVLYNCSCSRPSISSGTKETSINPVTETLNISIDPREEDGLVKCRTGDDTTTETYNGWYSNVYVPGASAGSNP